MESNTTIDGKLQHATIFDGQTEFKHSLVEGKTIDILIGIPKKDEQQLIQELKQLSSEFEETFNRAFYRIEKLEEEIKKIMAENVSFLDSGNTVVTTDILDESTAKYSTENEIKSDKEETEIKSELAKNTSASLSSNGVDGLRIKIIFPNISRRIEIAKNEILTILKQDLVDSLQESVNSEHTGKTPSSFSIEDGQNIVTDNSIHSETFVFSALKNDNTSMPETIPKILSNTHWSPPKWLQRRKKGLFSLFCKCKGRVNGRK